MTNRLPTGPLALSLLLVLTGCASCPDPIPTTQPPTGHLLAPTPPPFCEAETNGDLLECLGRMRSALDSCNADKAAVR